MSAKFDKNGELEITSVEDAKESLYSLYNIVRSVMAEKTPEEIEVAIDKELINGAYHFLPGKYTEFYREASRQICDERGIDWQSADPSKKVKQQEKKSTGTFWKVICPPDHKPCGKCGGTGKFCLYIENGQPKSNTGHTCYACGGKGYK
jgi:hypothetical protein